MAKITLDQLPMRVFRSLAKGEKQSPFGELTVFASQKKKMKEKIQIQRRKTKMTKNVYEIVTNKIIEKLEREQLLCKIKTSECTLLLVE